ncbi:hypothetical protein [Arthrobacter sp. 24S4-2]|uniref:hypothetical protein n=1 Tax=Arthrobacter sp. 24S4-2 TaxID=2575374 RepID=UPI00158609DC|nr:hypothetical protein [Arthrobacter sp. 24S4-2]
MAPTNYERTELVKARTTLAHARNRVVRFQNKAIEAAREVGTLEQRIHELEAQEAASEN